MELLSELEDKVLSKLIGLLNGMDEYLPDEELIYTTKQIILNLIDKSTLETSLIVLKDIKSKYLPNCISCASPCGRTNDFSLNKIQNEQMREDRIKEYREYLSTFDINSDFNDIIYHITKLSW